jgi:hypothetical protein
MIDDPERAMPRLDYAVAHNTEGRGMSALRQLVEEVIALKHQLDGSDADTGRRERIAALYQRMTGIK